MDERLCSDVDLDLGKISNELCEKIQWLTKNCQKYKNDKEVAETENVYLKNIISERDQKIASMEQEIQKLSQNKLTQEEFIAKSNIMEISLEERSPPYELKASQNPLKQMNKVNTVLQCLLKPRYFQMSEVLELEIVSKQFLDVIEHLYYPKVKRLDLKRLNGFIYKPSEEVFLKFLDKICKFCKNLSEIHNFIPTKFGSIESGQFQCLMNLRKLKELNFKNDHCFDINDLVKYQNMFTKLSKMGNVEFNNEIQVDNNSIFPSRHSLQLEELSYTFCKNLQIDQPFLHAVSPTNLIKLTFTNHYRNELRTNLIVEFLKRCPQLLKLSFTGDVSCLKNLPILSQLIELELNYLHNSEDDESQEVQENMNDILNSCPALKTLIMGTNVSTLIFNTITDRLNLLETLHFTNVMIDDENWVEFNRMAKLKNLSLHLDKDGVSALENIDPYNKIEELSFLLSNIENYYPGIFENFKFQYLHTLSISRFYSNGTHMAMISDILQNVGHQLLALSIDCHSGALIVAVLISTFCPNLKILKFINNDYEANRFIRDITSSIYRGCKKLEAIQVEPIIEDSALDLFQLPKLVSLHLIDYDAKDFLWNPKIRAFRHKKANYNLSFHSENIKKLLNL